jgi:hypothetical protein
MLRVKEKVAKELTIIFLCQVDWAKGCPVGGKTLFRDVSVRMFPEEISI